jgi:hypothetical protein
MVNGLVELIYQKIINTMKRKRFLKEEVSETLFNENNVVISKNKDSLYFLIGNELTTDIAEAVSILMRRIDFNDPIWKTEVRNIDFHNISPEKSLFWLSGGYKEWENLKNYNKSWGECYLEFQEEFGFLVINAVRRAKRLKDIRDYFIKYLNLPVLYDFSISKDLVR